jgi:hypothetical protein
VASISVWRSSDDSFEESKDGRLGAVDLDPSTSAPSSVSFSDLSGPALSEQDTYLFVTADLTDEAEGDIRTRLSAPTDVRISGGTLATSSGDFPTRLGTGAVLGVDVTPTDEGGVQIEVNAADQNVQRFEIERKVGGEQRWKQIQTVDNTGKQTTKTSVASDEDVPYEADSVSYRVKRIDQDGTTFVSAPVMIERDVDALQLLGTYPNPASQRATVRYAVPEDVDGTVRIHLYDIMGRRVQTVTRTTEAGRRKQVMDVSGLASGVYFLRLTGDDAVKTQKMTIVR